MNDKIVELKKLSKYYTSGQQVVVGLNEVSLSFTAGEFVAVTGESGSGKSTLAHILGGILPYESGEMYIHGKATSHYDGADWESYRRDRISFISQNYGILPGDTVKNNVTSVLRMVGYTEEDAGREADAILKKVDLWEMRDRRAAKLSSGQKQRLSIARALAKPAAILIADEPTGNLDSENSEKVIRLLAEAARERLVVLITHDFESVDKYATRRLVLQDGRIVSDNNLRSKLTPPEERRSSRRIHREIKPLGGYVARLQMRMHPLWCTVMFLFLCATAFAVFVFFGTLIMNIDDTSTRIYSDTAFKNGDKTRLVVKRSDGGLFTDADFDILAGLSNVSQVERYDVIADCYYYCREGVDFEYKYSYEDIGEPFNPVYKEKVSLLMIDEHARFIRTVPMQSSDFLASGRLPESYFEIVINENDGKIGDTLRVYIRNEKEWPEGVFIAANMKIVGTTKSAGIFFHDSVGWQFQTKLMTGESHLFIPRDPSTYTDELKCEDYPDDVFRSSELGAWKLWTRFYQSHWPYGEERYGFYSATPDADGREIAVFRANDIENDIVDPFDVRLMPFIGDIIVEIKESKFYEMVSRDYGTQASVFIDDYAHTDSTIKTLKDKGYISISPYRLGSTRQDPKLAEERINTLIICLAATVIILLLEVILIRVLFTGQTESYKLLANMGLTCKWARSSAVIQLLFFALLSEAVCVAVVYLLANYIGRINDLVIYLKLWHVLLLCGIHLFAVMLGSLWVANGIRRQVFPFTARYSDIDFEETQA